ncbi:Hypothetical_protein [Hexamita inflata]|uniref:Hypothetical_protein n=1 Tax=Hexamita inflata TaxID=28002 RepID=A0AA86QM74_9EUKA|nr:Hypothetical protein HINF_LOCUS49806 [Hexamita inflata]
MSVEILNNELSQTATMTLQNYNQILSSWICGVQYNSLTIVDSLHTKEYLHLFIDASKIDPVNIIVLYTLLKLFQIQKYDQWLQLVITDSVDAVKKRHKVFNSNSLSANISWLWCHIGLYSMHIGFNTVCNLKTNIFNKFTGLIYICPNTNAFYVVDGQQTNENNSVWEKQFEKQYNFETVSFNEKLKQNEIVSYEENDLYLINFIKELSMLYIMRIGVQQPELNPLAQLLPIFQFSLIKEESKDGLEKIQDLAQYNQYLEAIESFQEHKAILSLNSNNFMKSNFFQIPFHAKLLNEDLGQRVCVQILLDQSQAFKTCYMVLNFVFHQCSTNSLQNTNYVLADGSQCGKTSFDLSLYYTFMFHQDLLLTPVMVQRKKGAQNQPLMGFNSVVITDVDDLCKNYLTQVKQIDLSQDNEQQLQVFQELVAAGVQDAYSYPDIIYEIARKLKKAFKQNSKAKTIIANVINNSVDLASLKYPKYKKQIEFIENNEMVLSMKYIIQCVQDKQTFNKQIIQQFLTNQASLQFLFKRIKKLKKVDIDSKFEKSLYIFDEVCYRNIDQNPNTFDYCQLFSLIESIISMNKETAVTQTKTYLQLIQKDNEGFQLFLSQIQSVTQLTLLIFPLTIFLKANLKNELDTIFNYISNLSLKSGDKQQVQGVQFLTELASIQAFEAIMYRDLNYILYNFEEVKLTFHKNLITGFLIESVLQNKQQLSINISLQIELFKKYVTSFNKVYQTEGITFFMSGTFCSLTNFVRYTEVLLTSSSSRGNVLRSVHSCPTSTPQFHTSKLQSKYYLEGVDSNFYKDPEAYFDSYYQIMNNLQSQILNLFQAMNPYQSSFIQSLYAQVSPQLIIIDPKNKNIVYTKSHQTYCKISENDQIIQKIRASTMNHQLSIQKTKQQIGENTGLGKQDQLKSQSIEVYYNSFQNKQNMVNDKCLKLTVAQGHDAQKMQSLTQSNIKQLTNVGNFMIKKFINHLITQKAHPIAKVLLDNISFLGHFDRLNESMFLLYYLVILKYGIESNEVKEMEILLAQIIPKEIQVNKNKLNNIFYYGISHTDNSKDQNIQATLTKNPADVLKKVIKQEQCINQDEIYISFLAPELVQLTLSKQGLSSTQQIDDQYQYYWDKQTIMSQVAAQSIFIEYPSLKVIIIAIKIDDSDFYNYLCASSNTLQEAYMPRTTPDYLITFNFVNGGENAFNVQLLDYHSKVNSQNILFSTITTYSYILEIAPHDVGCNKDKCKNRAFGSISSQQGCSNSAKAYLLNNTLNIRFLDSFLKLLKKQETVISHTQDISTDNVEPQGQKFDRFSKESKIDKQ